MVDRLSPLHMALGETEPGWSHSLFDRAVTESIPERHDLDWKRTLTLLSWEGATREQKDATREELAKDIAAMANSGGGMIVYGVDEDRTSPSSGATEITGCSGVDEATTKTIRQIAASSIYPPVTGLQFHILRPEDGAEEKSILVMLIPDSPDRPHLVHPKGKTDWFMAPWRNGPETSTMAERQLADAYVRRTLEHRRNTAEFDEVVSSFIADCNASQADKSWVIAVARPVAPAADPLRLSREDGDAIFRDAWKNRGRAPLGPQYITAHNQTRLGMRRIFRAEKTSRTLPNSSQERWLEARVEVHGDGTIAVGFTRDGAILPAPASGSREIAVCDIEQTSLDLLLLLQASTKIIGAVGDYQMRIDVVPTTTIFRHPDGMLQGHFREWDGQRVTFRPVSGPLITEYGVEGLITSWFELVTDSVAQTGVESRISREEVRTWLTGSVHA